MAYMLGLPGMAWLQAVSARLLETMYPGVCAACARFCDSALPLCPDCEGSLAKLSAAAPCGLCGAPLAQTGDGCPWCGGKGLYPFERVLRLGVYEEPLRTLIHRMKYDRRWPLAEILADRLLARPAVRELLGGAVRLAPVPLHFRRHWLRGYNQADVLARWLAGRTGVPLVRPLRRTRDTEAQAQLHSRRSRVLNVRGAFALRRGASLEGLHVVVVDDVMTTGATLQEVGRTLLARRPARLSAVVLAVADPRHRHFETV